MQSTACTLWRCDILPEGRELLPSWELEASRERAATTLGGRLRGSPWRPTTTDPDTESLGRSDGPHTFSVVIEGDRFLYKMVRNIVGAIVAVGCGHLEPEDVRRALDAGGWGGQLQGEDVADQDRGEAAGAIATSGPDRRDETRTIRRICAPARGLTLTAVHYPEDVRFDWHTG